MFHKKKIVFLLFMVLFLVACSKNNVYMAYEWDGKHINSEMEYATYLEGYIAEVINERYLFNDIKLKVIPVHDDAFGAIVIIDSSKPMETSFVTDIETVLNGFLYTYRVIFNDEEILNNNP